ncbi:hypothetical protein CBS147333_10331 [Penicillium roqueforti]|nr:hypothetical protein CBS147333_10331 [Penicillium roqueforti]KAI3202801.1 hypothetical protein CBS147311_4394 [Penicillium roqueforti]KAI3276451.1 hypothetical protein DTO003C3_10168 [Penicillium roqueforti]KAI3278873.1 hypothetical protein CBS147308_214 [Penicillium roqueforti]
MASLGLNYLDSDPEDLEVIPESPIRIPSTNPGTVTSTECLPTEPIIGLRSIEPCIQPLPAQPITAISTESLSAQPIIGLRSIEPYVQPLPAQPITATSTESLSAELITEPILGPTPTPGLFFLPLPPLNQQYDTAEHRMATINNFACQYGYTVSTLRSKRTKKGVFKTIRLYYDRGRAQRDRLDYDRIR